MCKSKKYGSAYTKWCKIGKGPVSYSALGNRRIQGMDLKEALLNYLTDNDEGMKHLITWFLNEVMQEWAFNRRPEPGDTGGPVQGSIPERPEEEDAQDTAWRANPK